MKRTAKKASGRHGIALLPRRATRFSSASCTVASSCARTRVVKIVEETEGFFSGEKKILSLWYPPRLSLLFFLPSSLSLFEGWIKPCTRFAGGVSMGLWRGYRVDFNPVNESVKKLVFYERVKKRKRRGMNRLFLLAKCLLANRCPIFDRADGARF